MQDYVGGSEREDRVVLGDPEEDRRQIAEAARIAEQADVVLRALGGIEQTSREAWSFTHLGDRPSLDLVGRQVELLDAIAATGKPIVALVFNGAPLAIQPVERAAATIFECWYVSQETGRAVADVLFGDFKPGGNFRSPSLALPDACRRCITISRWLAADTCSTKFLRLYAFGYGLSYTSFEIRRVRLAKKFIAAVARRRCWRRLPTRARAPAAKLFRMN